MEWDVIIVGAGVAGLACARALSRDGASVVVLDKAKKVGGRLTTRRFDGQPVDFGPLFIHGRDAAFLAEVDAVAATKLAGWPARVNGRGAACQPDAFASFERRIAFVEGIDRFAQHLSEGVETRLEQSVERVVPLQSGFEVQTKETQLTAEAVVLTLPVEQDLALLKSIDEDNPVLRSTCALLEMFSSVACLTLVAGYPKNLSEPPWDVSYPDDAKVLQLIAHDSSKRSEKTRLMLVYQALPRWSREHFDDADWQSAILTEAANYLGDWAKEPQLTHPHRWRHARVERSSELAEPVVVPLLGGRLGLAGDIFARGGGVQASWLSGVRLAERLLERESDRLLNEEVQS